MRDGNTQHALSYTYMDSPVGVLTLVGDLSALHILNFPSTTSNADILPEWQKNDAPFTEVIKQLRAYFAGELQEFDLPLSFSGTEFQNRVWQQLATIPFGETRSYGQMAAELGSPGASRAVGSANNKNPLAIILPCHRVIGADGSMTGFGGGVTTKTFLLEHEAKVIGAPTQLSLF